MSLNLSSAPRSSAPRGDGVCPQGSDGEETRPSSRLPEPTPAPETASARKSNNPKGRPTSGITETVTLISMPASLKTKAQGAAKSEGVGLSEYVRRAVLARLGETREEDSKPESELHRCHGVPTLPEHG